LRWECLTGSKASFGGTKNRPRRRQRQAQRPRARRAQGAERRGRDLVRRIARLSPAGDDVHAGAGAGIPREDPGGRAGARLSRGEKRGAHSVPGRASAGSCDGQQDLSGTQPATRQRKTPRGFLPGASVEINSTCEKILTDRHARSSGSAYPQRRHRRRSPGTSCRPSGR